MTMNPHLTPSNVPLGTGPPTKEELLVHYPAKFTWHELKTFINAGYATSFAIDTSAYSYDVDLKGPWVAETR